MEVQVLGSLRVTAEGNELSLGGSKQKRLLALLVAGGGRVVSDDRLIEGLWGDADPAEARKPLRTCVSRLRSVLNDRIERSGTGYRFVAEDGEVDACRFEDQATAAMALVETDPAAAAAGLRNALDLWRGRPYAEFDDVDALRGERVRLEELRLAALESRIEAELSLGHHGSLIGELEALTGEYPLRERFRAQHMLALYRSGRQADALRAYQRTRRVLAEELGIDPSAELQDLEGRILRQDPSLHTPNARPGAAALPGGTLTLLFTDIESSTVLWEQSPAAMRRALALHDEMISAAIRDRDGHLIKNKGDGFFAVFTAAPAAMEAALAAQEALRSAAWPEPIDGLEVRMALHSGFVEPEGGDYFGPEVNRVARLEAAAHGGQVILSESTWNLVGRSLPAGVELLDLGDHKLRDLSRPERVFQLRSPALRADFPPLRTARRGKGLPSPPTSFVGRERELDEIDRLLTECRLLTLVGPGGSGKTRLAVQAAHYQAASFPGGAHFVPLQGVGSIEFVVPAIADSLGFSIDTHASDLDAMRQLLDYLRDRHLLLVLDNFEHLIEASDLVSDILESTSNVRLLVTSREPLGIAGEWSFDVTGLDYPRNGDEGPERRYGALELFEDRARQADPGFVLTESQRAHALIVCRLVGGLPLGVELAAAWVPVLSCEEIATEIAASLDFLASRRRDVPAHHRSARAVCESTWRLLPVELQSVFPALSTFRGGFSRDAAARVADADLQALAGLATKSIMRRDPDGRYHVHELLRQFGAELLEEDETDAVIARDRHARFYAGLLADRREELRGEHLPDAREEIRTELENVRAAARWAATRWSRESALAFFDDLWVFYVGHGYHEGAIAFASLRNAVDPNEQDGSIHAALGAYQAAFLSDLGRHEKSAAIVAEVTPRLRRLGMDRELKHALFAAGINALFREQYDVARSPLAEAIAIGRADRDDFFVAASLLWSGWVDYEDERIDAALGAFRESFDLFSRLGSNLGRAFALSKLGLVADARGDFDAALAYHREGFTVLSELGDAAGVMYTTTRMSMSLYGLGDDEAAIEAGRAGLEASEEIGHQWGITASLCRIGFPAVRLGRFDEACHCFAAALRREVEHGPGALALYAGIGIGLLYTAQERDERAVEVLAFCLGHPATPDQYRFFGRPVFEELQTRLPADVFATARERGEAHDATTLIGELLTDLG